LPRRVPSNVEAKDAFMRSLLYEWRIAVSVRTY